MKAVFIIMMLLPQFVWAALTAIDDAELSDMTGQAFINLDRSSSGGFDFTKVTLGLDVKTSLNSDLVELGRYERSGEVAGSSDIRISDFALGHINDKGEIVPFEITDPFIELAFETVNGRENLVGVRLGFGEAKGKLSGNIEYLTGNIDIELYGTGSYLSSQMSCGFFDLICEGAKALVGGAWGNDEFAANASLVNASNGNPDPIRATHVGMPNGSNLSIPDGGGFTNFLLGLFSSSNCELLSTQTCFPLSLYRTLDIGNKDTGEAAEGLFLSFQTKNVGWVDGGTTTTASEGAFMNIPNGGIRTSFPEAFNGIPRARTKYVDPYFD